METFTGSLAGATTNPAPLITCYRPAPAQHNGHGLVIFPGGGYGALAPHEGKDYAEYFAAAGYTCFVVTYRLGTEGFRHPAMLEDALAAIGTVRARASEWGINPQRIGVMGSSAGGHLAAHSSTAYGRYPGGNSLRPDFTILCYPVIQVRGPYAHTGSRERLIGAEPSEELLAEVACVDAVTPQTPPCFLWHTVEDAAVPVENSIDFAQALRRNNVPFELHIYQKGRHGLGLNTELDWATNCLRWVRELFI